MNARSTVSIAALAGFAAAVPCAAGAQTVVSASLVSEYDYRGVTQSAGGPAFQPAIDYLLGDLHLQAWSSNVTFDNPRRYFGRNHSEVTLTADVKAALGDLVEFDGGASFFDYPGRLPRENYGEGFVTANAQWLSLSLHGAPNYDNSTPRLPAYYAEANAEPPVGETGFRLSAHAGTSWGPYWTAAIGHSYSDYAFGATQEIGAIQIALRFVGTRQYAQIPASAPLSGAPRFVLTMTLSTAL